MKNETLNALVLRHGDAIRDGPELQGRGDAPLSACLRRRSRAK